VGFVPEPHRSAGRTGEPTPPAAADHGRARRSRRSSPTAWRPTVRATRRRWETRANSTSRSRRGWPSTAPRRRDSARWRRRTGRRHGLDAWRTHSAARHQCASPAKPSAEPSDQSAHRVGRPSSGAWPVALRCAAHLRQTL